MDVEQFKRNPVICLQHDSYDDLPVAQAIPETVRVDNGKLIMTVQFPPEGTTVDAERSIQSDRCRRSAWRFCCFEALEYEDTTETLPGGQQMTVRIYRKQKLIEVSFVTIPSMTTAWWCDRASRIWT